MQNKILNFKQNADTNHILFLKIDYQRNLLPLHKILSPHHVVTKPEQ